MVDLIDRAALLAAGDARKMKDALGDWDELDNKTKIIVLRYAKAVKKLVETISAVDAVEVVRCKDCKNYCGFEHCKNGLCDVGSVRKRAVYPDDFCSYGERRTDATD